MELEYLRDSQGNLTIAFKGFRYAKQKKYKHYRKNTKWKCVEKDRRCRGSLLTFWSKIKLPELVTEHNHPSHSTTGEDHMVSDEAESVACTNPEESVLPLVNQEEIVHTDSSVNDFDLRSCAHNECQEQPHVVSSSSSSSTKTFSKSCNKELNKTQINSTLSGLHIMSQPSKSSLTCNALQNKSVKKLQAASAVMQSVNTVPQSSSGAVCIESVTHHENLKTLFPTLLTDEHNVDVILASEGQSIKCHKLILINSSAYFQKLLNEIIVDHCFPVVAFTDWHFWQLKALVEYLYCGKVTVSDKNLPAFLSFVETLQIKSLQSLIQQKCLLNKKIYSGKQNFQHNLPIQSRLNPVINNVPEQSVTNYTPVECQKRKGLMESEDSMKAEGVNIKFAKFNLFCTKHSDDLVRD